MCLGAAGTSRRPSVELGSCNLGKRFWNKISTISVPELDQDPKGKKLPAGFEFDPTLMLCRVFGDVVVW